MSVQGRKLITEAQASGRLSGSCPSWGFSQQSLTKYPSACLRQSVLRPVTAVGGLHALGNLLAHFIHAPSKCTPYQGKPGAPSARVVFSVESGFISRHFHGDHGPAHYIRRMAFCSCAHAPSPTDSVKKTASTSDNQEPRSISAIWQCHGLDDFPHSLHLTGLRSLEENRGESHLEELQQEIRAESLVPGAG